MISLKDFGWSDLIVSKVPGSRLSLRMDYLVFIDLVQYIYVSSHRRYVSGVQSLLQSLLIVVYNTLYLSSVMNYLMHT